MTETSQENLPQKNCAWCGNNFPASPEFFRRNRRNKDELDNLCKSCRRSEQQSYRSRPEVKSRIREKRKTYDAAYINRPGILERDRAHRKEYRKRPEVYRRRLEYLRKRYKRPEVQEKTQQPEVRKRKQAYLKTYWKEYRKRLDVQERYRVHTRNRRARNRIIPGKHTPKQIQELYARQKGKCYYCGKKVKWGEHHVDHTFPLSRIVGTGIPANDISYLVITCQTCNLRKQDKFPWEWAEGGKLL